MKPIDYIIIAVVLGIALVVIGVGIYRRITDKRRGGCCGDCSACFKNCKNRQ